MATCLALSMEILSDDPPTPPAAPPPPPPPPPLPIDPTNLDSPFIKENNAIDDTCGNVNNKEGKITLRPLYWKKMQQCLHMPCNTQITTVWRKIENERTDLDSINFKSLMTIFPARTGSKNRMSSYIACPGSNSVRLMDQKRSQAIAILLRNLPEGVAELTDPDSCDVDPSVLVSLAELVRIINYLHVNTGTCILYACKLILCTLNYIHNYSFNYNSSHQKKS